MFISESQIAILKRRCQISQRLHYISRNAYIKYYCNFFKICGYVGKRLVNIISSIGKNNQAEKELIDKISKNWPILGGKT